MATLASREVIIGQHLSDKNSEYYQGLLRLLRNCSAQEKAAARSRPSIDLPFRVEERDEVELEEQFSVQVRSKGAVSRARLTPRVAALVHCIDETLSEHAGGKGKRVIYLDGDIVALAARGLEGGVVERTGATPRLVAGYAMEDAVVEQMATSGGKHVNVRSRVVMRELNDGGGEHYRFSVFPGKEVADAVVINHFKTPAGPHQLAWLGYQRSATVFGAFPFQLEMLVREEGDLQCFPGRYYVDRASDVITLVPDADATMSVSHPYRALMDLVTHNSVTVDGQEFLLEKYMCVRGVFYYTLKHIDSEFEAPEALRSHFFSGENAAITRISFPRVKLSSAGVPLGWERSTVDILTSRYDKVMARVGCVAAPIVRPSDVFVALMDNNNLVLSSLDTTVSAERMPVSDEEDAALAIALHVNFRRHAMRGTLGALVSAVRKRHAASEASAVKLGWMALTAWLSRPSVANVGVIDDVVAQNVLDWAGNDFGVSVGAVDPWVTVEQEAGCKRTGGGEFYSHLPRPATGVKQVSLGSAVARPRVSVKKSLGLKVASPVAVTAVVLDAHYAAAPVSASDLTSVKQVLRGKMIKEQAAVCERVPMAEFLRYSPITTVGVGPCPVPDVDPYSALADDLATVTGGGFDRDVVTTGYRLAEVDIAKETQGVMSINDAKRIIPNPRFVRRPVIDAGVEGNRVQSQASLLGAVFKRNIGIPNNREHVDLDTVPSHTVDKLISVCFREDWQEILARHLNTGLWEPNEEDLDDFLKGLDESKARAMVEEFFAEGEVRLDRWLTMAKGKVKASREDGADHKVDHAQTILYLENKSTNAMYSSITRRAKRLIDECLRPEISLNAQHSDVEHEEWYNSLEAVRRSHATTYVYGSDVRCYDRSQEHVGMRSEVEFYRRLGLNQERLDIWTRTHGPKKAISMMYGVIFSMVWGGVSGIWKTLLRNGLINLMAVVVACDLKRSDIVTLDIKGDDMDAEFSRPVDGENCGLVMSSMFNMSVKFSSSKVRYMCKEFRLHVNGRWYFVKDPWPKVQSALTPLWVGNEQDTLTERWVSLAAELRHYDNGILLDKVAEAAQVFYGKPGCFFGMTRALARFAVDKNAFIGMFRAPERVM